MALTQVKSDGIATGAVTATQIATGAVTANDLEDSGVTAGTYGSSSAIPAITVDAKGRITSASTNSVTQVGGANGVDFNDNVRARFGAGNDLQVYHNGTNSIIESYTGKFIVINSSDNKDIELKSDDGSGGTAVYVLCDGSSGAVNLNHYGSNKLATTSTGINVTGTVTCDGLTSEGTITLSSSDGRLDLKDSNDTGNAAINYVRGLDSGNTQQWYVGNVNSGADIYLANDQTGGWIVFATENTNRAWFDQNGHFRPAANNTYDLGSTATRWRNIYTNDLNLSNEGGTNDVDGTWGSWTIQEGEDDLFLLNRRNGKKYKFNLTEVS